MLSSHLCKASTWRIEGMKVAVPIFWPTQTVWCSTNPSFPFGYSSTKRHLPPDQSTVILLLGCGVFRHLMFTSWCHEKADVIVALQHHEVLACDLRPNINTSFCGNDLRQSWCQTDVHDLLLNSSGLVLSGATTKHGHYFAHDSTYMDAVKQLWLWQTLSLHRWAQLPPSTSDLAIKHTTYFNW